MVGCHEISGVRRRLAAHRDRGALLAAGFDEAEHPLLLLLGYQRPHLGGLLEPGSQANGRCRRAHAVEYFVEDRPVHV